MKIYKILNKRIIIAMPSKSVLSGQDVIDIGSTKIGQKYVLGAVVSLDNPNWKGPWDCAEFTSWCAYQAYGLIFGAGGAKIPAKAEPYSGHWFADANKFGHVISAKSALNIPGASLIRAPAKGKIGHVAFAIGDGDRTLEARGAAFGVGIFNGGAGRAWSIGCLLPGVDYAGVTTLPTGPIAAPTPPPKDFFWLRMPNFKGSEIVALQKALRVNGVDPGPIDGEYGPMTNAAVISFQVMKELEVDGVVGPHTATTLGLSFPIQPTADDAKTFCKANSPPAPVAVTLPKATATFDGVKSIKQSGKTFSAETSSGFNFIIGSSTIYTDDMTRTGLFQGPKAQTDSLGFGVYAATDFEAVFGQWAHFIEPTLSAEGGARFATLNTYDRAAFTFGAPQLAAHTPGKNFIEYFRQLLALPDAARHFPELSLRQAIGGKTTVHLASGGGFLDLEQVVLVTRPNGKKENQLAKLMAYLNSSATAVDHAELSAAARLVNWLRLDPKAKELQISVFIEHAKANLARAKVNVAGFDGNDWKVGLWIMDIMHHGRGTFAEMANAMGSGMPLSGLKKIGAKSYKPRIDTIAKAIDTLDASGAMVGFKV